MSSDTRLHSPTERRANPRFRAWLPANLRSVDRPARTPATVIDISASGAYLRVDGPAPSGAMLWVAIPWAGGVIDLPARVIVREGSGPVSGIRINFVGGDARSLGLLSTLLRHLETQNCSAQQHQRAGATIAGPVRRFRV